MRPARWLTATLLALALAAGLTPAQAQDRDRLTPAARAQARAALAGTAAAAPAAWNEIMGAGDIDADPDQVGTDDLATSEILLQAMPATVFTAGDNQYPWGQIEDYQDPNGYSGTWGRAPLKAITCAAVGNHEYLDPRTGPAGFLDYFSPNCPHRPDVEYARTSAGTIIRTAYAFRPAPGSGWWAYVLDSQCTHHDRPLTEFGPSCGRTATCSTGSAPTWPRTRPSAGWPSGTIPAGSAEAPRRTRTSASTSSTTSAPTRAASA
jgi:hypothetical protein